MVNIYVTDETLEEIDNALLDYNDKNAPTDRSGLILFLLRNKKK